MNHLIDTHMHFDVFAKENLVAEVLDSATAAGAELMIAIGGSPSANALALDVAREHAGRVRCACGFDRYMATEQLDLSELAEQLDCEGVVAVGECGLDYHYQPETAPKQKVLFEENLRLSLENKLPVVVHSRDADEDTLAILKAYSNACPSDMIPGVLHCYTRGIAMAKALLDIGFFISFSGIVSFANAEDLRRVASYVPSERIVIETDSPYLAPVPMRGERNEPAYVAHVAEAVAQARGTSAEDIASITTRNARRLFRID